MDHMSANLAFGGREKIFGYKKLQGGGQEAYKKNRKKWRPFLLGAAKKSAWGHQMVIVITYIGADMRCSQIKVFELFFKSEKLICFIRKGTLI